MAITQNHVINIQPGVSAPLVIHCSQGDTGTQINLTVVNGDEEFDCSSYACSVHGVRSDGGNWGPITCTVSGSTVCFSLTSDMTAVAGACVHLDRQSVIADRGTLHGIGRSGCIFFYIDRAAALCDTERHRA